MDNNILSEIFLYISMTDLSKMILVNININELVMSKSFWNMYLKKHGLPVPIKTITNIRDWKYLIDCSTKANNLLNLMVDGKRFTTTTDGYCLCIDNFIINDQKSNINLKDFIEDMNFKYQFIPFAEDIKDACGYPIYSRSEHITSKLKLRIMCIKNKFKIILLGMRDLSIVLEYKYEISKDVAFQYIFIFYYYNIKQV